VSEDVSILWKNDQLDRTIFVHGPFTREEAESAIEKSRRSGWRGVIYPAADEATIAKATRGIEPIYPAPGWYVAPD
jgi:hypothetical protein